MKAQFRRVCPLCGSVLSATRFAEVIRQHQGMERQLVRLREAERRAQTQLRQSKEQARLFAQRVKDRTARQLDLERKRADDRVRKYQTSTARLQIKIQDLQRRLKMGETAQSEGLLEERVLLGFLKEHFPTDQYEHVGKTGDIVHCVQTDRGIQAGRILYEVKRVQQWSSAHVLQCAKACMDREADVAILVTNQFPAKRQYYFIERNVLVISPLALLPIVHTAREGLLNVHALRVSGEQKKRAVDAVYDYLAGGQYMDHVRRIAQHLADVEVLFHKEIASHKRMWDDRLKHYQGITAGIGTVHDRLRALIRPAANRGRTLPAQADKLLPKFARHEP